MSITYKYKKNQISQLHYLCVQKEYYNINDFVHIEFVMSFVRVLLIIVRLILGILTILPCSDDIILNISIITM